jgi:hypothetical protein
VRIVQINVVITPLLALAKNAALNPVIDTVELELVHHLISCQSQENQAAHPKV